MTTTPTLWRAEQQANTADSGSGGDDQIDPQIVALTDGSFVALWTSNTNAGAGAPFGTDIIAQRYDAEGNRIGAEFRANTFVGANEGNFTAAATPDGGFVVVYESTNASGTSLRFSKFGGTAAGSGTILADPGAELLRDPTVTVNPDGSFRVAYQKVAADGDTYGLFYTSVSASLTIGPSQPALLAGDVPIAVTDDQVDSARLTNGRTVLVSRQVSSSSATDDVILFRMLNSAGDVLGFAPTGVANTGSNGAVDNAPSVAALTGGGFVVAWQNTDATDTDIMFQRFNATGGALGAPVFVNSTAGGDDSRTPEVVGLADGGFVIVYDDNAAGGGIRLQRFNATGQEVGSEVSVTTSIFDRRPTVTLTDDGRLLIGWSNAVQTGPGSPPPIDQDVEFAIYDPRDTLINGDDTSEKITSRIEGATVIGNGGNDTLLGQAGADTLQGVTGTDSLAGRGGNDNLDGGTNNDTLDGGSGIDTLLGQSGSDSLLGGASGDLLVGGTGADTLDGGTGNDTLHALASGSTAEMLNELLRGGDGFDSIAGADGNDTIEGGLDADTVNGAGGSDLIFANTQSDPLGSLGADSLSGGDGNDTVTGSQGGDTIDGGQGNDSLTGNGGQDSLVDTLGTGNDTIDGLAGNDTLLGGAGHDSLRGGDGADSLTDAQGNDTHDGGVGNDTLHAGSNSDSLDGGIGDDLLQGGLFNDTVNGGAGADTLFGNDSLDPTGSSAGNLLRGGDGNDSVVGDSGDDTIEGGINSDTLTGNNGNDLMFAATQADPLGSGDGDVMSGGDGNDTLTGAQSSDTLDGGADNDSLTGNDGGDRLDGGDGADTLIAGTGADSLVGGGLNDTLSGQAGNDTLAGTDGLDTLNGGADADLLSGESGDDRLVGGTGDDTLVGGDGTDRQFGDAGLDVFRFISESETPPGAARDAIGDFEAGTAATFIDRIDLSGIDASALVAGDQAFTFIGSAAFTAGVAAQIRAFQNGVGRTIVQGNIDGDVAAEFEIIILNAIALANLGQGDFIA